MPLKGHVLVPDLARPVLGDVPPVCDSGIDDMVHSTSLCGFDFEWLHLVPQLNMQ